MEPRRYLSFSDRPYYRITARRERGKEGRSEVAPRGARRDSEEAAAAAAAPKPGVCACVWMRRRAKANSAEHKSRKFCRSDPLEKRKPPVIERYLGRWQVPAAELDFALVRLRLYLSGCIQK